MYSIYGVYTYVLSIALTSFHCKYFHHLANSLQSSLNVLKLLLSLYALFCYLNNCRVSHKLSSPWNQFELFEELCSLVPVKWPKLKIIADDGGKTVLP